MRGQTVKPKLGRDDWAQRSFMLVIGLYLIIALALPLYAMLSKAFTTYHFDLSQYEVQVSDEADPRAIAPTRHCPALPVFAPSRHAKSG